MGKRGPKPTPTKILKLRGAQHLERRKDEPEPQNGAPVVPKWLSDYQDLGEVARNEWRRLVKLLGGVGVITAWDRTVLAGHCQALQDYLEAREVVSREGMTVTTDKGNTLQHPAVGVMTRAWERVMKTGACLGLSPADRARLNVGKPDAAPADPKQRFFKTG